LWPGLVSDRGACEKTHGCLGWLVVRLVLHG
jgi:hypothetical protein